MSSDEIQRRAEAYPDLVELVAMGNREHQYGPLENQDGGWYVGHLPWCVACRIDELLVRLGEQ